MINKLGSENYDKRHALLSTDDEELIEKIAQQNILLRRESVQSFMN